MPNRPLILVQVIICQYIRYIELCQYYDDKYNELSQRMNQLRSTNKRFKEI